MQDFAGKAVVVFFGFTQCPDVCPTSLAELTEVMKKLGPDADRVQVLLITVDPERDTPEAVSYTHLDVYKRQRRGWATWTTA